MDVLCLTDQVLDFFRHIHLLIELGEQVIAFADVCSGGDGKFEHLDGELVLEIVMQQLGKFLQEGDQFVVMKIVFTLYSNISSPVFQLEVCVGIAREIDYF